MGNDLEILGPGKCRFILWLVAHGRCWTAVRLAHETFQIQPNAHIVIKIKR